MSRASLLRDLVASEEFDRVRALDDGIAEAARARLRGDRPRGFRAPGSCDERAIEIPWALARYRGERDVLDVGYVLAPPAWHAAVVAAAPGPILGVDVLPAEVPGYEGVVADVRALPLESEAVDVAFCISTLEHVGADRRWRHRAAAVQAARELRRVLRPGGRLLLTVPCGAAERHEGFVQREPESWLRLLDAASLDVVEQEVYVCDELGWHGAEHARGVRYDVERGRAGAVLCVELRSAG